MCVTVQPAQMGSTRVYTQRTRHGIGIADVTAYLNTACSAGPNCMLLHFPTNELELVHGAQETTHLMADVTGNLPAIVPMHAAMGQMFGDAVPAARSTPPVRIESFGAYHVLLSSSASAIVDTLRSREARQHIPAGRLPTMDAQLERLAAWYEEHFPNHAFVLACFSGSVMPTHPIVVRYRPYDTSVLFAPGLDGHDGELPVIGQSMPRDFAVAFGVEGRQLPLDIRYSDPRVGSWQTGRSQVSWAPQSVVGWHDNRLIGPNRDYRLPISAIPPMSTINNRAVFDALV